jgi:hypothetical protein
MTAMLKSLGAAGLLLLAGCLCREPNYRNYGERPHEWSLPGPGDERKVFGPIPFDEVKAFIAAREGEGWELMRFEPAAIPESEMVNTIELDRPVDRKEGPRTPKSTWTFDIPKTYDDGVDAPKKATVPPYLDEGVKPYRQKYLVIMRRWL